MMTIMKVFNFEDMPQTVKVAYNLEAPWYTHSEQDYLEWNLTHPYSQSSGTYITVNNWLIAETDETDKMVLIKH